MKLKAFILLVLILLIAVFYILTSPHRMRRVQEWFTPPINAIKLSNQVKSIHQENKG